MLHSPNQIAEPVGVDAPGPAPDHERLSERRIMAGETVRIQLGGHRRGSAVRGYAIVDAADADLAEAQWHLSWKGYPCRKSGRCMVMLHRAVLERKLGCVLATDRNEVTDHINLDKLDNRRANLRAAGHVQNRQNTRGVDRNNTSGYRGVTWHKSKRRWQAYAHFNGRYRYGGRFKCPLEAAAAAARLRRELGYSTEE